MSFMYSTSAGAGFGGPAASAAGFSSARARLGPRTIATTNEPELSDLDMGTDPFVSGGAMIAPPVRTRNARVRITHPRPFSQRYDAGSPRWGAHAVRSCTHDAVDRLVGLAAP